MSKEIQQEKHKNPVPAVDFLVLKNNNSKILLVRRKNDPFKGMLSIPGGFINEGETAEDAMIREAKEETSLVLEPVAIMGVYSDPSRDPRMHTKERQVQKRFSKSSHQIDRYRNIIYN